MAPNRPYFDTSYLVRLYLRDPGFEAVRGIADRSAVISSAWHAQAEVVAAFHRAYREQRLDHGAYLAVLEQFLADAGKGMFHWLPLTIPVQRHVETFFQNASATTFLRSADALHLACAAEGGFHEVFSNDRHLLAAAPLFGLKGINRIDRHPPQP